MRKIYSSEDLADLIASMRSGAKVAVGYVSSANLLKTTKDADWDSISINKGDFEGMEDQYEKIMSLHKEKPQKYASVGIQGILKVSQFVTNWQTSANYAKNARNFERAREDFMVDHGVHPSKIFASRREGYTDNMNYGDNGVMRNMRKDGTQSLSVVLNPSTHTNLTMSYYLIDEKGDLSNPMSKQAVSYMIKKKTKKETFEDLFNELDNAEKLKAEYREFCKAMKFQYKNHLMERILYIVGTVDGQPFIFLNNDFTDNIDGIQIKSEEFKKIAFQKAEKLGLTMDDWANKIPESKKHNKNPLLEGFSRTLGKLRRLR